jgi:hypothetical protein
MLFVMLAYHTLYHAQSSGDLAVAIKKQFSFLDELQFIGHHLPFHVVPQKNGISKIFNSSSPRTHPPPLFGTQNWDLLVP